MAGLHDPKGVFDLIWCDVDQCHYCVPRPPRPAEDLKEYFSETLYQVARGSTLTLAGTSAMGYKPQLKFEKIDIREDLERNIEEGNIAFKKYIEGSR